MKTSGISFLVLFLAVLNPAEAQFTPVLAANDGPCVSSAPTSHSVFADSNASMSGDGSYSNPYSNLSDAISHLQNTPGVEVLCLTGVFFEALNLNASSFPDELHIYGYAGGASLDVGANAVNASSTTGALKKLRLEKLSISGNGGSAVYLSDLERAELKNIHIDASGFSTGVTAIEGQDLRISDCTVSGGDTAIWSDYEDVRISSSAFDRYGFSGLSLGAEEVTIERNRLDGSHGSYGVLLSSGSRVSLHNNFFLNHGASAAEMSQVIGFIDVFNNSFSNNHISLSLDSAFASHALTVSIYNNIFSSHDGQRAYGDVYFGNADNNRDGVLLKHEDSAAIDNINYWTNLDIDSSNEQLVVISDYNLFHGAVAEGLNLFSWTNIYGQDQHSIQADPMFHSSSDLHIRLNSPAVGAGLVVAILWVLWFLLVTLPYLGVWALLTGGWSIELLILAMQTFGPFFGFVEGGASLMVLGPLAALSLVFAPLVHFVMLFRGQLYRRLRHSNRRQRAWQAKF